MHHRAAGFAELLALRFAGSTNAACWPRTLPGDFAEIVRLLGPGEGLVALDETRLRRLPASPAGRTAIDVLLADFARLRDAGRDPVLNLIHAYERDDADAAVRTDVFSWHADRAPIEADTWLCTYIGAASEGLPAGGATRKVDDPAIRAELRRQFGEGDEAGFTAWLAENSYDLHYTPRPGVTPYDFGVHSLWRIACDWPGSPVPPCIHRAPDTTEPRLLMIC